MAAAQSSKTVDFSKGLYAFANRFEQPPGTLPRISNFCYTRRGALRTVDGSLILSSLNGAGATTGQAPFVFIGQYNPAGGTKKQYALTANGTNVKVIDITGSSWSGSVLSFASAFLTPSYVQAASVLALALGNNVTPQILSGSLAAAPLTNDWIASNWIAAWQASTGYNVGDTVIPDTPNGHIYICIFAGSSGSTEPTFPTTPAATVVDNQGATPGTAVWQEAGPDTPPAPPGAAFFFYHQGFLYAWGTSPTYTSNNLDGPDALRQSDLQNFSSWNPLNYSFIGQGDGQMPQGGAVMTLGESGIPASSQLVLFKDESTYSLFGAYPNVSIIKAPTGVGCVAPGSVFFCDEVGIIRLSYRGIAVFDGQNDTVDEWTDPIRPYLFGGINGITPIDWQNVFKAKACRVDNPPMYLLACPLPGSGGALTRIFALDLTFKIWSVIDLPWAISAMAYIQQATYPNRSLIGGNSDGTIRRIFAGDSTWDGTPISWYFRTPTIGNPITPIFFSEFDIFGTSLTTAPAMFTSARLNFRDRDGLPGVDNLPVFNSGPTIPIDISRTLLSANLDLMGVGAVEFEGFEQVSSQKPFAKVEQVSQETATLEEPNVIFAQQGAASVPANAQSIAVAFAASAPNVNYMPEVSANWNTTWWYSNVTLTGFTANFNTPAPGDGSGSISWQAEISI